MPTLRPAPPTNPAQAHHPAGRPRPRLLAAGALVAIAAMAAACGGGSSKASSSAGSQGTSNADASQSSGVAYAQCMRSHGVQNFPDNAIQVNASGGVMYDLPQGVSNQPDFQSASQACRSKLPQGANGGGSSGNTQADLNFANCMRSHGVANFPEPNAQGRFTFTGGSGSGLNPNSPTFKSAMQTCRKDLPNGGQGLAG